MKRFALVGFALVAELICTGCGETFRPIIIPNPPTFPNPAAAHSVVTISDNAPPQGQTEVANGSAMVIDVTGDAEVSQANVGLAPVHAVQQAANEVLVVNQYTTGLTPQNNASCLWITLPQGSGPTYDICPTVSKILFSGTTISSIAGITLPPSSGANFVAAAPGDTNAYIALPTYVPDPINHPTVTSPSIAVVNTSSNLLGTIATVGNNPMAVAVTANKSKVYVANQGDSTITAFNVVVSGTNNSVNLSPRTDSPIHTSSAPIWLTARTDSQRVYVLEQNGLLTCLDTTATAGPDPFCGNGENTGISVPGATTMTYDINENRLYIPGGPIMEIVDVSGDSPQVIATITIPNVPNLPTAVPASAVAVTVLPDESRAYVASVPSAAQSSQVNISEVQGDGTTATYTYTWAGGHDLTPGITVEVSGIASPNDAFNGTYLVTAVSGTSCNQPTQGCTFQAANSTTLTTPAPVSGTAASTMDNLFPQVSVVSVTSNAITKTIGIPGFPDATVSQSQYYSSACVPPASQTPPAPYRATFRFMMAAGGDSSRAYLSICDAGNVNMIDTSDDTYIENQLAPVGTRQTNPPGPINLPQSPVFMIAGP